MEYITIVIMKQKTRFKNFGNIGYRSMYGRYMGICPTKGISVISTVESGNCDVTKPLRR